MQQVLLFVCLFGLGFRLKKTEEKTLGSKLASTFDGLFFLFLVATLILITFVVHSDVFYLCTVHVSTAFKNSYSYAAFL